MSVDSRDDFPGSERNYSPLLPLDREFFKLFPLDRVKLKHAIN
jgi:hypothetical protein